MIVPFPPAVHGYPRAVDRRADDEQAPGGARAGDAAARLAAARYARRVSKTKIEKWRPLIKAANIMIAQSRRWLGDAIAIREWRLRLRLGMTAVFMRPIDAIFCVNRKSVSYYASLRSPITSWASPSSEPPWH